MLKSEIQSRIAESWQSLQDSIHELNDPAASAVGLNPNWSIKDAISHIVAWEVRGREVIEGQILGAPAPDRPSHEEIDAFNAKAVEDRRSRSFDDVLQELEVAHKAILETIERLPDDIDEKSVTYLYIYGVTTRHMAGHASQINNFRKAGRSA